MPLFKKTQKVESKKEELDLDAEIERLQKQLIGMSGANDENYAATVEALAKLYAIRQSRNESSEKCAKDRRSKIETIGKVICNGAMVILCCAGLVLSYRIDQSDWILNNKQTMGFFNKIFKIKI